MNANTEHDIKSALHFLKNLYHEIEIAQDIKDLQDPNVLKKLKETIIFLEKTLSTQ